MPPFFTPTGGKGAHMPIENTANEQKIVDQTEDQPAGGSFEAITTQEQLDKVIKGRLARAEASTRKAVETEYADALEKAKQWDEQQEANKTELQKANDKNADLEKQLNELKHAAEVRAWIDEAAAEHGVQASLLRGNTQEEINSHAQAIKEALGQTPFAPTDVKAKPKDNGFVIDEARIRQIAGLRN